jgi:hypothetical protein
MTRLRFRSMTTGCNRATEPVVKNYRRAGDGPFVSDDENTWDGCMSLKLDAASAQVGSEPMAPL